MFLLTYKIEKNSNVADIVRNDYRAADVFRKYGIEYCCGGNRTLESACELAGLDYTTIFNELEEVSRTLCLPSSLVYTQWSVDFLTDYIINIHHQYLRKALPEIQEYLEKFASGHQKKFTYLPELERTFAILKKEMIPHLQQEEEILFPYIKQIAHAYEGSESYAGLLVRTLRKPVENVMKREHESVEKLLVLMRELTNNYTIPNNACISHQVVFKKLLELDNDLAQHVYLENKILFPKAIAMEKELLQS
jgi:regulator of cell morphogenesis and NO signaling